ncbi:MAG: alpha/beta hydrolase [Armatimonadia bacterium]
MINRGEPQLLWPEGAPGLDSADPVFAPTITPFPIETREPVGCVVVLPGGGYAHRAPHEGAPIAEALNERGFAGCVCDYRVSPYRHPYPLMDAQRAVRWVRANAEALGVNPAQVGILGFSAGGHLASTAATHWDEGIEGDDALSRFSCRPDAAILCYPVVSSGPNAHQGSFINLLGEKPPADLLENLSNELQVNASTPPTFLWHTADDPGVPVQNSLLFAQACAAHKVPFELHVYGSGRHGLGLAPEQPHVASWIDLCGEWLSEIWG